MKPILRTLMAGAAALSLDVGSSTSFDTHYACLPTNRWGLENIANLDAVPAKGATLILGAPKHRGGTGGPARVLAMIFKAEATLATDYTYDPRFFNKITSITEPSVFTGNAKVTTYTYDSAATDGWNVPTLEFLLRGVGSPPEPASQPAQITAESSSRRPVLRGRYKGLLLEAHGRAFSLPAAHHGCQRARACP